MQPFLANSKIPDFPPEKRRVISFSPSDMWSLFMQPSALVGTSSPQPQLLCPSGQSHAQMVAKAGEKGPQHVCHGTAVPGAYGLENSQEFPRTLHVSGDPGIHSGSRSQGRRETAEHNIPLGILTANATSVKSGSCSNHR